jgi:hypothetical protein
MEIDARIAWGLWAIVVIPVDFLVISPWLGETFGIGTPPLPKGNRFEAAGWLFTDPRGIIVLIISVASALVYGCILQKYSLIDEEGECNVTVFG